MRSRIYFQMKNPKAFPTSELKWLKIHEEAWTEQLTSDCDPYQWLIHHYPHSMEGLVEFRDQKLANYNFLQVVSALVEIDEKFPNTEIRVSDDCAYNKKPPREIPREVKSLMT